MKRITISMPDSMADDLAYLSRRLGAAQSALLVTLSQGGIADLAGLVRRTPDQPDEETIRRLRGESEALIETRLAEFRRDVGASE